MIFCFWFTVAKEGYPIIMGNVVVCCFIGSRIISGWVLL